MENSYLGLIFAFIALGLSFRYLYKIRIKKENNALNGVFVFLFLTFFIKYISPYLIK